MFSSHRLLKLICQHNFVPNLQPFSSTQTIFLSNRVLSMESGPVQSTIEKKLKDKFDPLHSEVVNESYKHSVPKGSESHFKVVIVSEAFEGKALIQRHRAINDVLSEEIKLIHALSIQAKTPGQWESSGHQVASTPPCLGGSKADRK